MQQVVIRDETQHSSLASRSAPNRAIRKKRRLFRFGLRTLFLMLTVAAVVLGALVYFLPVERAREYYAVQQ